MSRTIPPSSRKELARLIVDLEDEIVRLKKALRLASDENKNLSGTFYLYCAKHGSNVASVPACVKCSQDICRGWRK